jgi:predicted nuclease of restriction endonuclease-like (RecB) superfamily
VIVEEEQRGKKRAGYGEQLLESLAIRLTERFGKGFTYANLKNMRQFFLTFPNRYALRSDLSWTHYRQLMRVENPDARAFYESEQQTTADFVKDPFVLEFLGLRENRDLQERELETAILDHLQEFMLELGKGFAFVGRQVRITLDGDHFYIDLVFYNYLLRCFVLFDLKMGRLMHQDIGQMQMYANFYEAERLPPGDNPPIGIVLCADKNDAVVRYTLRGVQSNVVASRYQMYLPSEAELRAELLREKERLERMRRLSDQSS